MSFKQYSVPIINISKYAISNKEEQQLKVSLKRSVLDKNNNIKLLLAANLDRITERVKNSSDQNQVENFHEFMRAYTDIFTNNIPGEPKKTHPNFKSLYFTNHG